MQGGSHVLRQFMWCDLECLWGFLYILQLNNISSGTCLYSHPGDQDFCMRWHWIPLYVGSFITTSNVDFCAGYCLCTSQGMLMRSRLQLPSCQLMLVMKMEKQSYQRERSEYQLYLQVRLSVQPLSWMMWLILTTPTLCLATGGFIITLDGGSRLDFFIVLHQDCGGKSIHRLIDFSKHHCSQRCTVQKHYSFKSLSVTGMSQLMH
jgi:hypothetical protein